MRRDQLKSLEMYFALWGKWFWGFLVMEVGGFLGYAWTPFEMPRVVWMAVILIGFIGGPFIVFHRMRVQLDAQLATQRNSIDELTDNHERWKEAWENRVEIQREERALGSLIDQIRCLLQNPRPENEPKFAVWAQQIKDWHAGAVKALGAASIIARASFQKECCWADLSTASNASLDDRIVHHREVLMRWTTKFESLSREIESNNAVLLGELRNNLTPSNITQDGCTTSP